MIASAYLKKRYEAGRRQVDAEWRPWYERWQAAKQRGEPFDEPPPFMRVGQHDDAISDVRAPTPRFDRVFYTLLALLIAQACIILTIVLRT